MLLGWYTTYAAEYPEVTGFRPLDEFSEDGKFTRQGPWVISEAPNGYISIVPQNYHSGVQVCIVNYQPLPEAENRWVSIEQDLSQLDD